MDVRYAGVSHVSFSVPDLNRSKRWYAELFRWQEVMTCEDADSGFTVGAMSRGSSAFGSTQPIPGTASIPGGPVWTMPRSPLPAPEELSGWEQRPAASGVTYSPVSAPYGHVLSFSDPDGIALEFLVPRPQP